MESQIAANFRFVSDRIVSAAKGRTVRLVAVSKTKPKEAVLAAYAGGARHFGENYIQELVDKATDKVILEQCPDIKWHFIGRLQSNKVKLLLKAPKLWAIETVTSVKLADILQKAWSTLAPKPDYKLNVMIQVNTSGEEQKGGVEPNEVLSLIEYIQQKCPDLTFLGLMTIGSAEIPDGVENPDFNKLAEIRLQAASQFGVDPESIELSMGMSGDFEQAIAQGSSNVRVGSTIFGQRDYSAK